MSNILPYLFIILGGAFFGLIPILVKYSNNIDSLTLVFFRVLFGSIFMYLYIRLYKKKLFPLGTYTLNFILWSVILVFAIASYFKAIQLIGIIPSTLILSGNSIFILVFSKLILKERIKRATSVSLVISLLGISLVLFKGFNQFSVNEISYWGYFFALNAAFWTGLNFVLPSILVKKFNWESKVFYQNFFQSLLLLPFVKLTSFVFKFQNIFVLFSLGLLCSTIAFSLIYSGIEKVNKQYIGILTTSEFIIPLIASIFLFNEKPSIYEILGCGLLMVSYLVTFFSTLYKAKPEV